MSPPQTVRATVCVLSSTTPNEIWEDKRAEELLAIRRDIASSPNRIQFAGVKGGSDSRDDLCRHGGLIFCLNDVQNGCFTNPNGKLFVYDEQTNRIRQTNPAGAFYKKHGNTGYIQNTETGERHWTDLAERLSGCMETSLAGDLAIIRGTDATINAMATPAVVDAVKQLIHFLFWRTLVNRDKLDAILHTYSFKDFGFGIFREFT